MSVIKSTLLIALALLLIFTIDIITIGTAMNILLYPDTYIKSFDKNKFYEYLSNQINNNTGENLNLLSEKILKEVINEKLTSTLSYFRYDSDELDLSVKINSSRLKEIFIEKIDNIPICTEGQIAVVNQQFICRPSNVSTESIADDMVKKVETDYPNMLSIDLKEMDKENNISKVRSFFGIYKKVYIFSIIFLLILISTIFLINIKSMKKALRWISIPMLMGSISMIFSGIISKSFIKKLSLGDVNAIAIENTLKDIFLLVMNKQIIYGIVIFVIALTIFTISFFINKKK